jgi:hypothetical protein
LLKRVVAPISFFKIATVMRQSPHLRYHQL